MLKIKKAFTGQRQPPTTSGSGDNSWTMTCMTVENKIVTGHKHQSWIDSILIVQIQTRTVCQDFCINGIHQPLIFLLPTTRIEFAGLLDELIQCCAVRMATVLELTEQEKSTHLCNQELLTVQQFQFINTHHNYTCSLHYKKYTK